MGNSVERENIQYLGGKISQKLFLLSCMKLWDFVYRHKVDDLGIFRDIPYSQVSWFLKILSLLKFI